MNLYLLISIAGVVQANKDKRDRILDLLAEIDAKDHVSLPSQLASLMEEKTLRGSFMNWYDPPRRRGGHPPCECPDIPGDQIHNACLNRRLSLVNGGFSSVQTPNATVGFSIEGGRTALRHEYAQLVSTQASTRNSTSQLAKNLTDPIVGYVFKTDRATQKLLNEETLMTDSISSAWMNMVNVTQKVTTGSGRLAETIDNSTGALIDWFDSVQSNEETANYYNVLQAVGRAQGILNFYVNSINKAVGMVFRALNKLSASTQGSESSSSALGDALVSAADLLSSEVDAFSQSLPDIGSPTSDAKAQAISGMVTQYQQSGQSLINALRTTGEAKEAEVRNASSSQIVSQDISSSLLLASARNASSEQVDELIMDQAGLVRNIQGDTQNLSTRIDAKVLSDTNTLQVRTSSELANITNAINSVNGISGQLDSLNGTERTLVTSTKAAVQGYESENDQDVSTLRRSAERKSSQIVTNAQGISSGSVSAVGSNFQANMQDMGMNADSLISLMTNSAGSMAQASANAANALTLAATGGQGSVGTAGRTVMDSYAASFGGILNQLGVMPGTMASGTLISAIIAATLNEAQRKKSDADYESEAAASSGVTQSAKQLNDAEDLIGGMVEDISKDAAAGHSSVGAISTVVSSSSGNSVGASTNAEIVANSNSRVLSDAASSIGDSEDQAVGVLSGVVDQFTESGGQFSAPASSSSIGSGLSSTLDEAASLVKSAQTTVDQSTDASSSNRESAVQSLSDAVDIGDSASESAESSFQQSSGGIDQTADSSLADLDRFAAMGSSDASGVVAQQMLNVNSMQNSASLRVGKVTLGQLNQIRAIAASIQSLMQQVNAYLAHNTGPLANEISGLPLIANRLLLQLYALEEEATKIEAGTSFTGDYSWADIVSALQSILVSRNSSTLDSLLQINAAFNQTADRVGADIHSEISAVLSAFADTATSLETQIGGVAYHVPASVASNSSTVLDDISNITSDVSFLTNASFNALNNMTNGLASDALPSNISSLYALVDVGTKAAGIDSQYAASVLDQLAAQAKSQVNAVSQFNQTSGFVNPGDIDQQASIASINENVANSKLHQQQAFLDSLSGASTDLSGDYQAQVRASSVVASQNANHVFNEVVQGKAQVGQMVGNIAAQYAAQQSELGDDSTVNSAQQAFNLGIMRRNLVGLINVFDVFTGASNRSFANGVGDMHTFGIATLASLKQKLSAFEQQLLNNDQQIDSNVSIVNSTFQTVNVSLIDPKASFTSKQLDDWLQVQMNALAASESSLGVIGAGKPIDETTINFRSNATVNSLALAAQNLLSVYSIDLPRIDQIVAETSWNSSIPIR